MKKNYLLILTLFICFSSKAQNIPNGNFEQWLYNNNILAYEPTGWSSTNDGVNGDTGVYRYKPGHAGNYACGLKTSLVQSTYTVPGILECTFSTTLKPNGMEGYFKGNIALNDTAIIFIEFSKDTNVIADGQIFFTQSQNNYTKFIVPIDFFGIGNPDSCTITIIGGGFDIDDTLTSIAIDDLNFLFPVNTQHIAYRNDDNIQLYPNPATEVLNIVSKEDYSSIIIFNQTGQIIATYKNESSLSITEYNSGLYFLQLLDKNNQIIAKKSFLKN